MELIKRAVQDNSWAAFLFMGSFILLAILKSVFQKQFSDFLGLVFSNKYIKLYSDSNLSLNWFSFFMVVIQLVSFSFFFFILLSNFDYINKDDFKAFGGIFLILSSFVGGKHLIEKGIANLFNIQAFYNNFLFQQLSYRTYLGLAMLFITFVMYYTSSVNNVISYIFLIIFVIIQLIIYLISFKFFQKEILSNLFYFILYLCALEIAPYYFTYYWFTKY